MKAFIILLAIFFIVAVLAIVTVTVLFRFVLYVLEKIMNTIDYLQ